MDVRGILGVDTDVRNGFSSDQGDVRHRRRRDARRDQGARRAVAEALGGLRHHHEPDRRPGRGRLSARSGARVTRARRPVRTTTVVIGAGQGGLAMSRCLSDRSIDHVVLERRRGRELVADRALGLAPAAHAQLAVPAPRLRLRGRRPRRLHDDAGGRRVPRGVREDHRRAGADRDDGDVGAREPTTATASRPTRASGTARPSCSPAARSTYRGCPTSPTAVPPSVDDALADRRTATREQLAEGGVLVVGASATGVQIAHEIHRSGRPVTLAVGEHVRGPRMYRGRDIHWWMEVGRCARRALRRGRRHRARPPRAVDAARGLAGDARRSTSTR